MKWICIFLLILGCSKNKRKNKEDKKYHSKFSVKFSPKINIIRPDITKFKKLYNKIDYYEIASKYRFRNSCKAYNELEKLNFIGCLDGNFINCLSYSSNIFELKKIIEKKYKEICKIKKHVYCFNSDMRDINEFREIVSLYEKYCSKNNYYLCLMGKDLIRNQFNINGFKISDKEKERFLKLKYKFALDLCKSKSPYYCKLLLVYDGKNKLLKRKNLLETIQLRREKCYSYDKYICEVVAVQMLGVLSLELFLDTAFRSIGYSKYPEGIDIETIIYKVCKDFNLGIKIKHNTKTRRMCSKWLKKKKKTLMNLKNFKYKFINPKYKPRYCKKDESELFEIAYKYYNYEIPDEYKRDEKLDLSYIKKEITKLNKNKIINIYKPLKTQTKLAKDKIDLTFVVEDDGVVSSCKLDTTAPELQKYICGKIKKWKPKTPPYLPNKVTVTIEFKQTIIKKEK
jgi:hypothetical protein